MSNPHQFITPQGTLAYRKYGDGSKFMIAFHGFGQDGRLFEHLSATFDTYTIYSIDLYFHGASEWKQKNKPLAKSDWSTSLLTFLTEKNIDTFSVMAFSLGAKLALCGIERILDRTEKIYLIAPDGIHISFWYKLAAYPAISRRYFERMIDKPRRFHRLINALRKVGLVDKSILTFAKTQMNTKEKRSRVYYSWVMFRLLKPDLDHIAQYINRLHISTVIYLGKYDKIITQKSLRSFIHRLDHCECHVLSCGHNQLMKNVIYSLSQNT